MPRRIDRSLTGCDRGATFTTQQEPCFVHRTIQWPRSSTGGNRCCRQGSPCSPSAERHLCSGCSRCSCSCAPDRCCKAFWEFCRFSPRSLWLRSTTPCFFRNYGREYVLVTRRSHMHEIGLSPALRGPSWPCSFVSWRRRSVWWQERERSGSVSAVTSPRGPLAARPLLRITDGTSRRCCLTFRRAIRHINSRGLRLAGSRSCSTRFATPAVSSLACRHSCSECWWHSRSARGGHGR